MNERKFEVLSGEFGTVLASGMTLDMCFAFIRGYEESFYNEPLDLRIREMARTEGEKENDKD